MIWSAWRRSRRATMSPSLIVFTRLGSARMASINRASDALSTHGGTTRIAHGKSFRAWAHTRMRKDIRQDEGNHDAAFPLSLKDGPILGVQGSIAPSCWTVRDSSL